LTTTLRLMAAFLNIAKLICTFNTSRRTLNQL